jgi:hypothetical protein
MRPSVRPFVVEIRKSRARRSAAHAQDLQLARHLGAALNGGHLNAIDASPRDTAMQAGQAPFRSK